MKQILVMALVVITTMLSCKDEISESEIISNIYQLGKCNGTSLGKINADSCFHYSFQNDLVIDFCITGNCCPDSNRFNFRSIINNDSIKIFVKDIAPNLCKCNCNYQIHCSFQKLRLDKYIVVCIRENAASNQTLYQQEIWRKP